MAAALELLVRTPRTGAVAGALATVMVERAIARQVTTWLTSRVVTHQTQEVLSANERLWCVCV